MSGLSYRELDLLRDQSLQIFESVWEFRKDVPADQWIDLAADVMVSTSMQGEALGRSYGSYALPVNGQALLPPDIVTTARRPAPEDFEQRSSVAPEPDEVLDVAGRSRVLRGQYASALVTLGGLSSGFEDETIRPRVERLVSDETVAAVQRGYQDGLRLYDQEGVEFEEFEQDEGGRPEVDSLGRLRPSTTSQKVRGYRRGINPGCCELCFWLWKEGRVYPIDQPMHRHIGCRCVPVPTTDPVGRWALSDEEIRLLHDLYERYVNEEESA